MTYAVDVNEVIQPAKGDKDLLRIFSRSVLRKAFRENGRSTFVFSRLLSSLFATRSSLSKSFICTPSISHPTFSSPAAYTLTDFQKLRALRIPLLNDFKSTIICQISINKDVHHIEKSMTLIILCLDSSSPSFELLAVSCGTDDKDRYRSIFCRRRLDDDSMRAEKLMALEVDIGVCSLCFRLFPNYSCFAFSFVWHSGISSFFPLKW